MRRPYSHPLLPFVCILPGMMGSLSVVTVYQRQVQLSPHAKRLFWVPIMRRHMQAHISSIWRQPINGGKAPRCWAIYMVLYKRFSWEMDEGGSLTPTNWMQGWGEGRKLPSSLYCIVQHRDSISALPSRTNLERLRGRTGVTPGGRMANYCVYARVWLNKPPTHRRTE